MVLRWLSKPSPHVSKVTVLQKFLEERHLNLANGAWEPSFCHVLLTWYQTVDPKTRNAAH